MNNLFKIILDFLRIFLWDRSKKFNFQEKNIIFVDNRFPDFYEQIKIFFDSGFLNKEDTILVAKIYLSSYASVVNRLYKSEIKFHFYYFYSQIPLLDGKNVYYPYNSQVNARLILNRRANHIFLTHGESNKKASVNRMVRLYDKVLGTGDISCDRYLEYGIFNKSDIDSGRIVKVGDKITEKFLYHSESEATDICVGYYPTWEGGNESENFSSLGSSNIVNFLTYLCSMNGVKSILIRPHPNLGRKNKKYIKFFDMLIFSLENFGFRVYIDSEVDVFLKKHKEKKIKNKIKVLMGVCDVSASEFMLAANKIPSIILINKSKEFFPTEKYLKIRYGAIVDIENNNDAKDFFEKRILKIDFNEMTRKIYSYVFSTKK